MGEKNRSPFLGALKINIEYKCYHRCAVLVKNAPPGGGFIVESVFDETKVR
jgi:hypothetical protein